MGLRNSRQGFWVQFGVFALASLCIDAEGQVLIRRHDFDAPSSTGLHTVIGIGDVGIPSVVGDDRDGFHDYAVLNDAQQEVLVYNGRNDDPPNIVSFSCPMGINIYGGFGASGDGGKNVIGSFDVPDFVIGGPVCNEHPVNQGVYQGAIYIVDGDTLAITEWTLPDDDDNLFFGRKVHLMRDYSDPPNGQVEIFVGSDDWLDSGGPGTQGGPGIGYVIDITLPVPHATILPPIQIGKPGRFSQTMDYMGDSFKERENGEEEFGRDEVDRFDDLMIGDIFFEVGFPPSQIAHAGFSGYYIGDGLAVWRLIDDIPGATRFGSQQAQELGSVINVIGDLDKLKEPDLSQPEDTYWSWDGSHGEGRTRLTLRPSGPAGTQAFETSIEVTPETGEDFFPSGDPAEFTDSNTSISQACPVGDVNLDGYDDFALVVRINMSPEEHAVRIYSGKPPVSGPLTVLWNLSSIDNFPLFGTRGPRRTSVNRVGDVNGDGSDDWGIVTGLDTDSDGTADKTVIAIYGTNIFATAVPGPVPLATPRIGGNRMAEIGRDIFIHVSNGIPLQTGVVHRATALSGPVNVCGGQLWVSGITIPFTFDANGEAFVFDPLAYDPALVGSKRYYQVQTDSFGLYPCKLSQVRDVRIEDATNPDDL